MVKIYHVSERTQINEGFIKFLYVYCYRGNIGWTYTYETNYSTLFFCVKPGRLYKILTSFLRIYIFVRKKYFTFVTIFYLFIFLVNTGSFLMFLSAKYYCNNLFMYLLIATSSIFRIEYNIPVNINHACNLILTLT